MSERKTHEEFIDEIKLINPNIEIVDKYINALTPIECRCKKCNHIWFPKPNTLLSGCGCRKCGYRIVSIKNSKNHQDFVNELSSTNTNIEVVGKYVNNKTELECFCKICKNTWFPIPDTLLSGHGCPNCSNEKRKIKSRKSQDTYIKELEESHKNIVLIGNYINMSTPTKHRCLKCDYSWEMKPSKIYYDGEICPVCNNSVLKVGVNDLWTTHPDIAKLLENPQDGYENTSSSSKKVNWKCSECNSIIKNKRINYIVSYKLSCSHCADGISYPMKFIVCMLNQLNVNFDTEVTFKNWTFSFNNYNYKPRYDIVFGKYIIEVDGELHKRVYKTSKKSLEDIKYIDKMKDYLARENGYELIRIDCCESDLIYIKDNILGSKLNSLFNLVDVSWEQCHKYALSSKVKTACDLWNNLENPSVTKVKEYFDESRSTIQKWLKKGALIGLCNYNAKEESIKNARKYNNCSRGQKVICIDTLKVFDSMKEAGKYYNICPRDISNCCKNNNSCTGIEKMAKENLSWMYYDDYLKNTAS